MRQKEKNELVRGLFSLKHELNNLIIQYDTCDTKGCDEEGQEWCEACRGRLCYDHGVTDEEGECWICDKCAEGAAQ